jgi:transposase-like protein
MTNKREHRGIELVVKGHVNPIDSSTFNVKSEQHPEEQYTIKWDKKRWICTCEDFRKHWKKCKHIYAVCYYLSLRDTQVGIKRIGEEIPPCPICGKADLVTRDGFSETRSGLTQRFFCKRCNHGFSPRTGFEGAHGQGLAIVLSLDLYYRGLSLRQISEHFQSVYSIKVSHGTIYGWIKRYVELVSRYLNEIKVQTGERWHADETVVRVKGKHLVLWSMLDGQFRLLIAQHISKSKGSKEAIKLLEKGLAKTKNQPSEIITDAAPSYTEAINQKFGKELKQPLIHVQTSISSPLSNNKIERFNRTIKQRYKTISCFHSEETAKTFSKGFTIFYNGIKRHKSLGGKTPIQASDPKKDEDNWVKLIQKARK